MSSLGLLGPAPATDHPHTAPFWAALREGRLALQRCEACDAVRCPPGPRCAVCGSAEARWDTMSGRARLRSWTVFHQRYFPKYGDGSPYLVALLELEEGATLYTNLVGAVPDELQLGMPLEAVFEEAAEGLTLVRFRPAGS